MICYIKFVYGNGSEKRNHKRNLQTFYNFLYFYHKLHGKVLIWLYKQHNVIVIKYYYEIDKQIIRVIHFISALSPSFYVY